ncbi:FimB/Mfa2 family fimbrial subunit [Bacteroides fragilis]|jgi:hypothetical protein bfra3_17227|uniref:FimB/Mfa2 family fimbrial subunit n=1 Tax=Bacteroides fragilis TaxID=817 RepID=UPI000449FB8E|nr:FimB/Mfa2 family fimbrial subunit [Bacteroides fragilis]EXZ04438.1 hypothetical protein M072_3158 [Bacteroides fragilis str. DS-208]MCE8975155.1 FimB/Mfa2 family fimbrial subunit [Bacteroides fragilis]
MKSFKIMLITALSVMTLSCSEKTTTEIPETELKNISCSTQLVTHSSAQTRGAAPTVLNENDFVLYAFKKNGKGNFSYEKAIHPATAIVGETWKYNAAFPVGTYNFIAFYNLDENNRTNLNETIEKIKDINWESVLQNIVITHFPSASSQYQTDMNEIFCGKNKTEIDISSGVGGDDNEIKIELTLARIVSRIDIKFIKVASDNPTIEVPYETGNIFGSTEGNPLTSLIFKPTNIPLKYNLYGENPDYTADTPCEVTYNTPTFRYGESSADAVKSTEYQPFPKDANAINQNMETNIKNGIANGGAYFMGSYLLPFSPSVSQTLNANIQLNKANQERTIKVPSFTVTKNYVSVITIKLKSSTEAENNGEGNDDEHLFNPKSTFIVEIEKTYDGIHQTDVDVE